MAVAKETGVKYVKTKTDFDAISKMALGSVGRILVSHLFTALFVCFAVGYVVNKRARNNQRPKHCISCQSLTTIYRAFIKVVTPESVMPVRRPTGVGGGGLLGRVGAAGASSVRTGYNATGGTSKFLDVRSQSMGSGSR